MISGCPAPGAAAKAALDDSFAVDLADHIPLTGKERPRRADLGAKRQLALGDPVGAVEAKLLFRAMGFRPAGAIGAFIHDAPRPELGRARILGRPERAGIEAITAADTVVLFMVARANTGQVYA